MILAIVLIIYLILLYFLYKKFSRSKKIHGFVNKIIPTEFEKVIQIALGYYPELHKVRIEFLVMKWKGFHSSALPHPLTFFLPKKWRTYIIIISTQTKPEFIHGLLKNLPEKLQIGILGHELAHIIDYEQKNILQILKILWWYLLPTKRKIFENSIDILTIKHGLGPYLYGFYTHFISKNFQHTKKFMNNYLSDDDIKKLTKELTGKEIS